MTSCAARWSPIVARHGYRRRVLGAGARRAPVVEEDERRRLGDEVAHEAVPLVLRHHHHVTSGVAAEVRPRRVDVLERVAQRLDAALGEVLEVVAVGVVPEREVERDEEEIGLLGIVRAVTRREQLLVQDHIDAVPVVARPVAAAEGAEPRREPRRQVVHVDPRLGRRRPRRRRQRRRRRGRRRAKRAIDAPPPVVAAAPVVLALAAARAVVHALVEAAVPIHRHLARLARVPGEAAALGRRPQVDAVLHLAVLRVELVRQLDREHAVARAQLLRRARRRVVARPLHPGLVADERHPRHRRLGAAAGGGGRLAGPRVDDALLPRVERERVALLQAVARRREGGLDVDPAHRHLGLEDAPLRRARREERRRAVGPAVEGRAVAAAEVAVARAAAGAAGRAVEERRRGGGGGGGDSEVWRRQRRRQRRPALSAARRRRRRLRGSARHRRRRGLGGALRPRQLRAQLIERSICCCCFAAGLCSAPLRCARAGASTRRPATGRLEWRRRIEDFGP